MASASKIEWTESTWNPVVGCSIVSPGCTHCYAMRTAARLSANPATPHYHGTLQQSKAGPVWTGKVAMAPERVLLEPLKRKKPTTWFVNSMGDLFHESVPDDWIDRVFAVMALTPQHTYQVLTKRAERMREYFATADDDKLGLPKGEGERRVHITGEAFNIRDELSDGKPLLSHTDEECIINLDRWPLPNVWLGVSTERQQEADERIPHLLQTPAAVRFISAEPLLGPIDLTRIEIPRAYGSFVFDALRGAGRTHVGDAFKTDRDGTRLDWIIVGGESGSRARPMHPQWARSLRDQCEAAGVPFFFKQWGEYLPLGQSLPGCGKVHGGTAIKPGRMKLHYGGTPQQAPKHAFAERGVEFASTADGRLTFRVGKKAAGRLLDGVEHNAMPGRAG